mgnify:CR=1 FL=1
MNRRGVGLAELIVALTLSAVMALLAWSILAVSATRLRERSERIGLTHALRVSAGALRAAIEPLGSDSSGAADLASFGPDGFSARVIRAAGVVCLVAPEGVLVRAGEGWWTSLRAPVAGRDSLLIGTVVGAARWVSRALSGLLVRAVCPDGSAAILLPVVFGGTEAAGIGPGSPLRLFEPVEFRRYNSGGGVWIGVRLLGTGESIQPLAGPFATAGVSVSFRRSDGSLASTAAEATRVVVGLLGLTERAAGVGVARLGSARADSVEFAIAFRNLP